MFASLVLLTAATKIKEKKPIKTGASSGYITILKQSIMETFDIYGYILYYTIMNTIAVQLFRVKEIFSQKINIQKCGKIYIYIYLFLNSQECIEQL